MPPAAKFAIKTAVFLCVLAAAPFLVEWGLRSYDWERDSYVHPSAVTADGGAAVAGLNRLRFREVRFASTGLELRLRAFNLLETMRDDKDLELPGGTIRLFRLDGPESAQPGPEPPPDAVKVAEFRFRSEVVDAPPAISADGTELRPTKDALFSLVPANKGEEPAADAFAAMRLPAEATFEIDLEFDPRPDLPASNRIEIAYCKPMRSLLRGTFLESASERLLGSTRPSSK